MDDVTCIERLKEKDAELAVLSRNNRELYTHIREGLEEGDEKEYLQKTLYILAKYRGGK